MVSLHRLDPLVPTISACSDCLNGGLNGPGIYRIGTSASAADFWRRRRLPASATTGDAAMNDIYTMVAAVLAAGLLVYLIAVLLFPEDFS